jgi:2-oxoisovalerate/pyruvate ferredoxin oxidoreductase gamma subunit
MIEIRFHGRGGQGAVVASNILASAFFAEGKWAQAFPSFGGERRGAPVAAFVRADGHEIAIRSNIYRPDHVVVLDASLIKTIDVTAGLKENGWIIINSSKPVDSFSFARRFCVAAVDANSIAVRHRLGSSTSPIVNTVILGAFSRVTQLVGIDAVIEAIRESVPSNPEKNILATEEAYQNVSFFTRQSGS